MTRRRPLRLVAAVLAAAAALAAGPAGVARADDGSHGDGGPTLVWTSPLQDAVVLGPAWTLTVEADAGPGSTVTAVAFEVDGRAVGTDVTSAEGTATGGTYSVPWTFGAAEGRHRLRATVSDASGATASASVDVWPLVTTSLALTTTTATATYGDEVVVTARLRSAAGAALAGAPVVLTRTSAAGTAGTATTATATTATTDGSGVATWRLVPQRGETLAARFAGSRGYRASASGDRALAVRAVVRITGPAKARRGTTVSGTVTVAPKGRHAVLVQYDAGSGWTTVGRGTTAADGTLTWWLPLGAKGTYRLRAARPATSDLAAATSAVVTVVAT